MNILTTEVNTEIGKRFKDKQRKLHENYNWRGNDLTKKHPIIMQRYKNPRKLRGKYNRIKVDTSVLVQYLKKYSIYQAEFMKFAKLAQDSADIILRIDLRYKYMTHKVVRKITDYFYSTIEEEFKIDIKQLIPDEWEDFTDET